MNTGQMMMVAIAIMLLGKMILSGNSMISQSEDTTNENQYISTATSIAQSMIERISVKQFDELYSPGQTPADANVFTKPKSLGMEAGDDSVINGKHVDLKFDDIDDYKGYSELVTTQTRNNGVRDTFFVSCNVYYLADNGPYTIADSVTSNSATFTKGITVTVGNSYMVDPNDLSRKLKNAVPLSKVVTYR
jgi:hypothetical protein